LSLALLFVTGQVVGEEVVLSLVFCRWVGSDGRGNDCSALLPPSCVREKEDRNGSVDVIDTVCAVEFVVDVEFGGCGCIRRRRRY
jgi:hypothetical protein